MIVPMGTLFPATIGATSLGKSGGSRTSGAVDPCVAYHNAVAGGLPVAIQNVLRDKCTASKSGVGSSFQDARQSLGPQGTSVVAATEPAPAPPVVRRPAPAPAGMDMKTKLAIGGAVALVVGIVVLKKMKK